MSQFTLVSCNLSQNNDNHSDKTESSKTWDVESDQIQGYREDNDDSIKAVEYLDLTEVNAQKVELLITMKFPMYYIVDWAGLWDNIVHIEARLAARVVVP